MPSIAALVAEIGLDLGPLKKGMAEAKGEVQSGGGVFAGLGDTLGKVGGIAALAGTVGVGALVGGLVSCIGKANEAAAANAQLEAVIKSTGGVAGVTAQHAQDLATQMAGLTKFDDQAVQGAESMLLTFTNIGKGGGVFDQATKTALNMSQALGQDLKSSSIQLGKALNDPVAGISALSRVGVTFSADQKSVIAALVKTGDTAGAQKVILAELNREFGGSAEAAGKTLPGQLAILQHKFDNARETIGTAFLPVLSRLLTAVTPLLNSLGQQLPGAMDKVSSFINANIVPAFNHVLPLLSQIAQNVSSNLVPALVNFAGFVGANVIPVLVKLGEFIIKNVVPTLVQLAVWFEAKIVPILKTLWGIIQADVIPALEAIWKTISTNLIPSIQKLWDKLSPILIPVLHAVGDTLKNVVGPALNTVIDIIGHLIDFLATAIGKLGDFLGFLGHVKDAVGDVLGGIGNGLHNAHIPGFAAGGVMPHDGLAVVGEHGPELVALPGGSRVYPNGTAPTSSGGGNTYHNYFYGTNLTAKEVVDEQRWQAVMHG